jgi:hypothetical protein
MAGRRERFLDVDVENVFFTHARIRPFFSGCGRRLVDTLEELENGEMKLESLPQITILATPTSASDGQYFSLNNRRLWVLKQLRSKGKLKDNLLRVRVKDALPRELEKYTRDGIERKSSATIMGVDKEEDGSDGEGEGEEDKVEGEGDGKGKGKGKGKEKKGNKRPAPVPPLSSEAKAQLKVVSKKAQKLKGKKFEQQLMSMIDELIVSGTIQENQETMARAAVEI